MASRKPSPLPWLDPLRNILKLEQSRGFDNTAVVGGLDKFLQHWADDLQSHLQELELVGYLSQSSYAAMPPEQRRQWSDQWLRLLAGEESSASDLTPLTPDVASPTAQPDDAAYSDRTPEANQETEARSSKFRSPPPSLTVDAPVNMLQGVDTKLSQKLQRLDVSTVRDLLYLFPRRHLDYSRLVKVSGIVPNEECTLIGRVWEARTIAQGPKGRRMDTEAVLSDETGNVRVIWFGQRYMARTLKPNSLVAISGKADVFRGQIVFESPEYDLMESAQAPVHTGRLVPVYPLTEGLTGRNLRRLTWQALNNWLGGIEETLAPDVMDRAHLIPLQEAIHEAHYPDDLSAWESARERLAFDELFTLQLAVFARKRLHTQDVEGVPINIDRRVLEGFFDSLSFRLTAAQDRCIRETLEDMSRGTPPMNRLLQGEVGSGKTVVALAALLTVAAAGYQGAIMVPTEVLAEQHFQTVGNLLSGMARPVQSDYLISVYLESMDRPVSVGLLTGSTRQSWRRELTQMASDGTLDLIIGTHALIQEGVSLPNLALAVADEQHRFGVLQRAALRKRGAEAPHTLLMSATPIPRTLSLTLYGDLEISTIDELPAGRQQIATRWLAGERRQAAYGFLRKQVQEGRQAFVICPLVEESDAIEAAAATEQFQRLSKDVFPDLKLGLLHGRMSAKDKERVMRSFRDGDLDILVSTAVVEVGIDVANATLMLIEGAERFGLAQLHQFRGRVGRGEHKSYCLLVSDTPSEVAKERLSALENIHDGFRLAEVDLELRGPGDYFGTRQSGLPNLRMAHLSDVKLLETARKEAAALIALDPDLKSPEHEALAARVAGFLDQVSDEAS